MINADNEVCNFVLSTGKYRARLTMMGKFPSNEFAHGKFDGKFLGIFLNVRGLVNKQEMKQMMNCFIISTELILINIILNASRPRNHMPRSDSTSEAGTGTLPY